MTTGGTGQSARAPTDAPEFAHARLSAATPKLDLRVDAVRGDYADIALAHRVSASRYVKPVRMVCCVARTPMRATPEAAAVAVSELLFGEAFDVFEGTGGGWTWGRTLHDGYLGWVDTAALAEPDRAATHRVTARSGPVFAAADIKAPILDTMPSGALVSGDASATFLALAGGGHIHVRHVEPVQTFAASPLAVARLFTGAPYVWGGRTPDGVDCSGLVQAALNACGITCPRDSDQQLAAVGSGVAFEDRTAGDLVFFPGHVGILASRDRLFHANAFWMTTLEEPLADVIARLAAAGVAEQVLGVRRPSVPPP